MPQLLVRDVPPNIVDALNRRAAEHRRSAEAEHPIILEDALRPEHAGFWQHAAAFARGNAGPHLGPVGGADPPRQRRAVSIANIERTS